jgi:signal transduction histidine kinase
MITQLKKIIDIAIGDPVERRRAQILNVLILGLIPLDFLAALIVIILSLIDPDQWGVLKTTFWAAIGFLPLAFLILWMNQRGLKTLSSASFLFLLTVAIIFASYDGLKTGGTLFYFVIPVIIASVILPPVATFIVAGCISLFIIVLPFFEELPSSFYLGTSGIIAVAFVAWVSARSLERALSDLNTINQNLDQRVVKRTEELIEANRQLEARAMELARANEQLESLDKLKSKFVSDVSHELRTPITNLTIYTDILERGRGENWEKHLKVLQVEIARLSELVNDILNINLMDVPDKKSVFHHMDMNELISRVLLINQPRAKEKGLKVSFESGENMPVIWADSNQISMVVNNLVSNAINYTNKGFIRIQSAYKAEKDQVELSVEDTGMGIDQDDLSYIFDRFYRGKWASQSNVQGTGLGLSICREIISTHKGSIEVHSQPGKGSIFTVYLPSGNHREQMK